jgi:hypothetical protein
MGTCISCIGVSLLMADTPPAITNDILVEWVAAMGLTEVSLLSFKAQAEHMLKHLPDGDPLFRQCVQASIERAVADAMVLCSYKLAQWYEDEERR